MRTLRLLLHAALLLVLLPCAAVAQSEDPSPPPGNDAFARAFALSIIDPNLNETVGGTTVNATSESGEPSASCIGVSTYRSVWYAVTPTTTGEYVLNINIQGGNFAIVYDVFSGSALGSLTSLACGTGNGERRLALTGGQRYYVRVFSYANTSGDFSLSVRSTAPPANDAFASAETFALPAAIGSPAVDVAGTLRDATTEAGEAMPSCASFLGSSAWYRVVPDVSGIYAFSLVGSTLDSQLDVVTGSAVGSLSTLGCQRSSGYVTAELTAGQAYYVRASRPDASGGAFTLRAQHLARLANDLFASPQPLAMENGALFVLASGDNTHALLEANEPEPSCADPNYRPPFRSSLWYTFTPTTTGDYSVMLESDPQALVDVLTGSSLSGLTSVACTERGDYMRTVAALEAGQTYYLRVSGMGENVGPFTLELASTAPPPNDALAGAEYLRTAPGQSSAVASTVTYGATSEAGELTPSCLPPYHEAGKSVWYRVAPGQSGPYVFDTPNVPFRHLVDVFEVAEGTSALTFASLQGVGCTHNVRSGKAVRVHEGGAMGAHAAAGPLTVELTSGREYVVRVAGLYDTDRSYREEDGPAAFGAYGGGGGVPSGRIELSVSGGQLLPVELVGFSAVASGRTARLAWETASETNNAFFAVERHDGAAWIEAGRIDGHGTTTERHAYAFSVPGLTAGMHRFRLRQVDTDGTHHLSDVVTVEIGVEGVVLTVLGTQAVRVEATAAGTVELLDVLGRRVYRSDVPAGTSEVPLAGLAAGAYFVRAAVDGQAATARLVVR